MERTTGIEPVKSSVGRSNAINRLDDLRTNLDGSIEFVHLLSAAFEASAS